MVVPFSVCRVSVFIRGYELTSRLNVKTCYAKASIAEIKVDADDYCFHSGVQFKGSELIIIHWCFGLVFTNHDEASSLNLIFEPLLPNEKNSVALSQMLR